VIRPTRNEPLPRRPLTGVSGKRLLSASISEFEPISDLACRQFRYAPVPISGSGWRAHYAA
jgi:hypothetical protein